MSIPPRSTQPKWKSALGLGLLTIAAVLVQGYHPFSEDAEIYLPGAEKILHPELFPVGQEFFKSHASMTLFPNVVAFSLRITHLPLEAGLFLWHLASIFLLLLACWELSGLFFPNAPKARWGGVCLVAVSYTHLSAHAPFFQTTRTTAVAQLLPTTHARPSFGCSDNPVSYTHLRHPYFSSASFWVAICAASPPEGLSFLTCS